MKVPTGCMFTHIVRGEGKNITYQNAGVDCGFGKTCAYIHVIDWGAIITSVAVGALTRWACQARTTRTDTPLR
ncbi:hypothetical protein [Streptomyces sp. NPDC054901]